MVSNARLDLPDPESPVITTRASRGMSTSIDARLCSRAPRTSIFLSSPMLTPALHGQEIVEGAESSKPKLRTMSEHAPRADLFRASCPEGPAQAPRRIWENRDHWSGRRVRDHEPAAIPPPCCALPHDGCPIVRRGSPRARNRPPPEDFATLSPTSANSPRVPRETE